MHGPRDRRRWAAFKEIHMVCDCWFMHDRKKREARVWSGLEDHKWKVGKRRARRLLQFPFYPFPNLLNLARLQRDKAVP